MSTVRSATGEPWTGAVVRFTRARQPVGSGLLITPDTILTCAHVVNSALGRPKLTQEPPDVDAPIEFDLPQLPRPSADEKGPSARLIADRWSPPLGEREEMQSGRDLALLRIGGNVRLPVRALAQPLAGLELPRETPIAFYGFPAAKFPNGNHASGTAMGVVGGGVVQVTMKNEPDNEAMEGYSGTPIWCAIDGAWRAVGLATYRQGGYRLLMQPAAAIAERFPFDLALDMTALRAPDIAPAAVAPAVEALWRLVHLVDRDEQCAHIQVALAQRHGAAPVLVLHGLPDDRPEKLIKRHDDEFRTQAAAGDAAGPARRSWPSCRSIDWPSGETQSVEAQLRYLRDRLAVALDEPPFADDRAIAAALGKDDAPRVVFSVAYQSRFTVASARAATAWADLWSRLPSLGLDRRVAFVLVAVRDEARVDTPRRGLLGRLFGGGEDVSALTDIRRACDALVAGRPDAAALPSLYEWVERHIEEWLQQRVALRQPRYGTEETRLEAMQEIMRRLGNPPSFRLRALEDSLMGKG